MKSFDTREIREAVGDLICGLSVYELYEIDLNLRELEKQFEEKSRRFSALLEAMPTEERLARVETIDERLGGLWSSPGFVDSYGLADSSRWRMLLS